MMLVGAVTDIEEGPFVDSSPRPALPRPADAHPAGAEAGRIDDHRRTRRADQRNGLKNSRMSRQVCSGSRCAAWWLPDGYRCHDVMFAWSRSAKRRIEMKSPSPIASPSGTVVGP